MKVVVVVFLQDSMSSRKCREKWRLVEVTAKCLWLKYSKPFSFNKVQILFKERACY